MANIIIILGIYSFILGNNNLINSASNNIINGHNNSILNNNIDNIINGNNNSINSSNNIVNGSNNSAGSLGFYLGYNNNSNNSYYNFQFGNNNFIANQSNYNFQFGVGLNNTKLNLPNENSNYNMIIGYYNDSLNENDNEIFTIGNGTSATKNSLFKIVDSHSNPYLQFTIPTQGNDHKLFYSDLPLSSNYISVSIANTFVKKEIDFISDYTSARNSIDDGDTIGVISDFIRIHSDLGDPGESYAPYYKRNGITRSIKGNIPLYIFNMKNSLLFGDPLFRFAPSAESIDSFYIQAYKNGTHLNGLKKAIVNSALNIPSYRFDGQSGNSYFPYTRVVSLLVSAGAVYWADSPVGPCPYIDETSAIQYYYLPNRLILDTSWIE